MPAIRLLSLPAAALTAALLLACGEDGETSSASSASATASTPPASIAAASTGTTPQTTTAAAAAAASTTATATPAAAPRPYLSAPPAISAGQAVTVVGSHLSPRRRYRLSLGAPVVRGTQTVCGDTMASAISDAFGRARFRGIVAARLRCLLPDGSPVATVDLAPERRPHAFAACVPLGPGSCNGRFRLARRSVRILENVRDCGEVDFGKASAAVAFRIRATGVGCDEARRLARGSRQASDGCFNDLRCRYVPTGGRWQCNGRDFGDAPPRVGWSCLRDRGRKVTWIIDA